MKLSVRKRWGFIHVRGGRFLRVTHDHQVTTDHYDNTTDREGVIRGIPTPGSKFPAFTPRQFGTTKWVTAKVGDLAVELVAVKTDKVIGILYLSGAAINLVRYEDRMATPSHWFVEVIAWVTQPEPRGSVEDFIGALMRIKYSDVAALATFRMEVPDEGSLMAAARGFAQTYSYHPHDECDVAIETIVATTHLLGVIQTKGWARRPKKTCTLHLQPPKDAQEYAVQPFGHEVVLSSPHLVPHDFFGGSPPNPVTREETAP